MKTNRRTNRNFLGKIVVRLFPNQYKIYCAKRTAQRRALQAMVLANNRLRDLDMRAEEIDYELAVAVALYDRGRYSFAEEYANET